jgi:hypothetical protein
MDNDNRTMLDLVKNAVGVQDACNLSGVVHSFSRDISRLRELLQGAHFSTDQLNRHPVCVLYAAKIASLTKYDYGTVAFSRAYDWCRYVMDGHVDLPLPELEDVR